MRLFLSLLLVAGCSGPQASSRTQGGELEAKPEPEPAGIPDDEMKALIDLAARMTAIVVADRTDCDKVATDLEGAIPDFHAAATRMDSLVRQGYAPSPAQAAQLHANATAFANALTACAASENTRAAMLQLTTTTTTTTARPAEPAPSGPADLADPNFTAALAITDGMASIAAADQLDCDKLAADLNAFVADHRDAMRTNLEVKKAGHRWSPEEAARLESSTSPTRSAIGQCLEQRNANVRAVLPKLDDPDAP
jgi:hypothetical protein